jgi:hypothetical protein
MSFQDSNPRVTVGRFACRLSVAGLRAAGRCILLFAALVAIGTAIAGATVNYVDAARPNDSGDGLTWATAKQTIPAAIAVSAPGDEILIKYGGYVAVSPIQLTSDRRVTSDDGTHNSFDSAVPDADQCTITGADLHRIMTISGESVTDATTIRGLTATHGRATYDGADPNYGYGGGILIEGGADPLIEQCSFLSSTAGTVWGGYGGGIACTGSGTSPAIHHCRVAANIAATNWGGQGAGIYCGEGTVVEIEDCSIEDNVTSLSRVGAGGGIYCNHSDTRIVTNSILRNTNGWGGEGGGIYCEGGNTYIRGNTISYNVASGTLESGYGGGIAAISGVVEIRDNVITHNTGSAGGCSNGGGIDAEGVGGVIDDNLIADNAAGWQQSYGGGLLVASSVMLRNNRIARNTASLHGPGYGGGICFLGGPGLTIERNQIYRNVASAWEYGEGGGTWCYNATGDMVRNNTFYRNANSSAAPGSGHGSGMTHASGGAPVIVNNVFANHDVAGSDMLAIWSGAAITIYHNAFHANPGGNYNSNVTSVDEGKRGGRDDEDPRFADPDNDDFTLLYDSPLIEEGDPATEVPEDGGWRVDIGACEYTGSRQLRSVDGPGELLFGGVVRAKLDLTEAGSLSTVDAYAHPGESHPGAPHSVQRWYSFAPTGGGAVFDLTLSYKNDELNGLDENALALWRWTGSAWAGPFMPAERDTADNWLRVAAQSNFGEWIIARADMLSAVDDPQPGGCAGVMFVGPNPFRESVTVRFRAVGESDLAVFSPDGRLLSRTPLTADPSGECASTWDGRDGSGRRVPPGTYFVRLRTDGRTESRTIRLVR